MKRIAPDEDTYGAMPVGYCALRLLLMMTPELRKLITDKTDVAALREQASREGMKPLRISGALKVASGMTTPEEVIKVAPPAI